MSFREVKVRPWCAAGTKPQKQYLVIGLNESKLKKRYLVRHVYQVGCRTESCFRAQKKLILSRARLELATLRCHIAKYV